MPYRILFHPRFNEFVGMGGALFAASAAAVGENALAYAAAAAAFLVGFLPAVKRFVQEVRGVMRIEDKKDRDAVIDEILGLREELRQSRAENAALMEQVIHSTKGVRNDQVIATKVAEANQKLLVAAVKKSSEAAANSKAAVETINAAHGSSSNLSLPAAPPETETES